VERAERIIKRVKASVGYAIVIVLFATLLALELASIALVVIGVVAIVTMVRLPISPGDLLMNLWRAAMVALFGAMACLGIVLAVLLPYQSVTAWITSARQSPGQVARAD
jgi:hypothetical protein